jgi:hypothetical protein
MSHEHRCECGTRWQCEVDIIPAQGSRARCKESVETICEECFQSIVARWRHDPEKLVKLLQNMKSNNFDPPLAARATKELEAREGRI